MSDFAQLFLNEGPGKPQIGIGVWPMPGGAMLAEDRMAEIAKPDGGPRCGPDTQHFEGA